MNNNEMCVLYTQFTNCHDCYKCIRHCPVKAIQIVDGHASILQEKCIACGTCVGVCPAKAKRIRNDLDKLKVFLEHNEKVIISLAPSFRTEFIGLSDDMIIGAIKKCGIKGVSETALGAQEVNAYLVNELNKTDENISISSACPVVVDLIKKHFPHHSDKITDIYSPLMAHAKMLKKHYGDDHRVVFVGPCVAKKNESDEYKQYIDLAITFDDLKNLFKEFNIDTYAIFGEHAFIPEAAREGILYPVDGGMIAGLKDNCSVTDSNYMFFSGVDMIMNMLSDLNNISGKVFLELLACEGGCINGPCTSKRNNVITKRQVVFNKYNCEKTLTENIPQIDINGQRDIKKPALRLVSDKEIQNTLNSIGKYKKADQLNCGGCGYDTCIEFSKALVKKKAEVSMCVSYMKKLANKKANALLRSMPSGVVIVDHRMQIVESNLKFAQILGDDLVDIFKIRPGLEDSNLSKVFPADHYFKSVLNNDKNIIKTIKIDKKVVKIHIFPIEQGKLVGGIIQDITEPAIQKEHVINNAKDVIKKNLETVQKIAYLLGENAAESESILNKIIGSFGTGMENDDDFY